jgi:hypothetical protein
MLLSVLVVNIGVSPANTKLYLDPTVIPDPGLLGHPGDEYTMSLKVDDVTDLWSWGCEIHLAPYSSVLNPSNFVEGSFLVEGWEWDPWYGGGTYMAYNVDSVHGIIYLANSRLAKKDPFDPTNIIPREGATGSGTLVTFKLTVLEAGDSPIELVNTYLLDIDGNPISHKATGSEYNGATARLIRTQLPDGRHMTAGDTFTIESRVKNEGDVPLTVRVRYDISRAEDARIVVIRAGQTYTGGGLGEPLPYEYIYVDEFNEWYYEFNGDPTNLFGTPDGSYIEGDTNAQWASLYGFESLPLAGRTVAAIWVETYSRFPNGFTEAVDIDLYGFSSVSAFAWWGSSWGSTDWGWVGTRWIGGEDVLMQMPELADQTELNNVELLVYNYHGDAPDVMQIDSIRLRVEFASIVPLSGEEYVIPPGAEMDLDPVTWVSDMDQVGTYELTATIEYTEDGYHWNSWGSAPKTSWFVIAP